MDILFSKTMNQLSHIVDYRAKRHKIIASNIANIDTEGYQPSDLTFKQRFEKSGSIALTLTDPRHMDGRVGAASFDVKTSEGKVKIDTEMANLAENQLMYNVTVDMLARKFRGIGTVLKETK
jgi:flagellar basal-body rod protein FlgB